MAGLRGAGSGKNIDWPEPWDTTYPNAYSKYNLWQSSGTTMAEIFRDFMDNVINDTSDLRQDCIQKLL